MTRERVAEYVTFYSWIAKVRNEQPQEELWETSTFKAKRFRRICFTWEIGGRSMWLQYKWWPNGIQWSWRGKQGAGHGRRAFKSNSKKMKGFPNGELEEVPRSSWKPILHIASQLLVQCCHVILALSIKTHFHIILSIWGCVFEARSMCFICHTSCAKEEKCSKFKFKLPEFWNSVSSAHWSDLRMSTSRDRNFYVCST